MPKGAFYAFPYVGDNAETYVMDLVKNGVISAPGSAFGKRGKGYMRFSYATSMDNIKKAVAIMGTVFKEK
jgi:aspartate aminotransferase